MTQPSESYIARCKCGEIVGAISIQFGNKEVAKTVQRWIGAGLRVECVASDIVKAQFGSCRCEEIRAAEAEQSQPKLF